MCLPHVWGHVQTMLQNVYTMFRYVSSTFTNMFTPCFKTCLHNFRRHYATLEDMLTLYLNKCEHNILINVYTMFEDMFIQCFEYM